MSETKAGKKKKSAKMYAKEGSTKRKKESTKTRRERTIQVGMVLQRTEGRWM